jgi:hypothetical protein
MQGKFHEKFNDPVKAVCYVSMGVGKAFPTGVLEVTYRAGMRMRQQSCPVRDIGRVLEQMCYRFPRTSVYYDPSSPDGNIAELRCHCDGHLKLNCCHHKDDRPRVLLRLVQTETCETAPESVRPVASDSHPTPSSLRDNWR